MQSKIMDKSGIIEISETDGLIIDVVGKPGMKILEHLSAKTEIDDFELAKKMKLKINEVRALLQKLYTHKIVTFRKAEEKKNWFSYYWKLNTVRIAEILSSQKKIKQKHLMEKLEVEANYQFYSCINSCIRLPFHEAVSIKFSCTECNSPMIFQDNTKEIEKIKNEMAKLEVEIAALKHMAK